MTKMKNSIENTVLPGAKGRLELALIDALEMKKSSGAVNWNLIKNKFGVTRPQLVAYNSVAVKQQLTNKPRSKNDLTVKEEKELESYVLDQVKLGKHKDISLTSVRQYAHDCFDEDRESRKRRKLWLTEETVAKLFEKWGLSEYIGNGGYSVSIDGKNGKDRNDRGLSFGKASTKATDSDGSDSESEGEGEDKQYDSDGGPGNDNNTEQGAKGINGVTHKAIEIPRVISPGNHAAQRAKVSSPQNQLISNNMAENDIELSEDVDEDELTSDYLLDLKKKYEELYNDSEEVLKHVNERYLDKQGQPRAISNQPSRITLAINRLNEAITLIEDDQDSPASANEAKAICRTLVTDLTTALEKERQENHTKEELIKYTVNMAEKNRYLFGEITYFVDELIKAKSESKI